MLNLKSKFNFFRNNNINYLDNAATTQVPDSVIKSVSDSLKYKGNPGRGSHITADKNKKSLQISRENIARFIGANTNELVFTSNATDAINILIQSIYYNFSTGDEILIALSEHHSNMLPYVNIAKELGLVIHLIDLNDGAITLDSIKKKISKKTKLVAIAHISNVLGIVNDVELIGDYIKKNYSQCIYVVDGTQSVAHISVNVQKMQADFFVFSGHKMYGPDGIGVLYVNINNHNKLRPIRTGGGSIKNIAITRQKKGDIISPNYFENISVLNGGTSNMANITGLAAAVTFLNKVGFENIQKHENRLLNKLLEALNTIPEIEIYPKNTHHKRIGLISFSLKNHSTSELADYLNEQLICIRYGSHCAIPLSDFLGSETIRISLGIYSTEDDIKHIIEQVRFFINKKNEVIINQNFEKLRSRVYYKNNYMVDSFDSIIHSIEKNIDKSRIADTEIIVMGGHFLAIPDQEKNKFCPSIQSVMPKHLYPLLNEFGMKSFSVFTWRLACRIVSYFQLKGYKAKLSIIANDTTGINELKLSSLNSELKTAEIYRNELLLQFESKQGVPDEYIQILEQYKLGIKDIVKNKFCYYFRETTLRANFKKFIKKNKKYFDGIIDYEIDDKKADISINILDNHMIKTCVFDTFQSKTGGVFCIAEFTQFIAELFGTSNEANFSYLSERVKEPKSRSSDQVLISITPEMCNNAVISAGELYSKLFIKDDGNENMFNFFNIPLGSDTEYTLSSGIEMICISDKDY